jgi:hypothetical protein
MTLALNHEFKPLNIGCSNGKSLVPTDVAIDELHGTLTILDEAQDLHVILFDRYLISTEQNSVA